MRDTYRDWEYYDALIEQCRELAQKNLDPTKIEEMAGYREENRYILPSRAAEYLFDALRAQYARGDERSMLQEDYLKFIDMLWGAELGFRTFGQRDSSHDISLIDPIHSLAAIAFGVGLGAPDGTLHTLAECIPSGYDALVDRLLAPYQPGRAIHDKLREPAMDRPLLKLLDAPAAKQPGLILKYLNNYEKTLSRVGDSERHTLPTFDGYWSYPAAAVVAAFAIDDSLFIDHEYYPGDLMSWRKKS